MHSLIFAAGLGTRLKPLTETMPKALVPVLGKPLLQHTLDTLIQAGCTEAVVNVHHFGQQIIDFVQQHAWPIPVRISDEREQLLDTGGGLRQAARLFSGPAAPILIHNVDIFSNARLQQVYEAGKQHDAVLLVSARDTQRYLLFDDDMRLCGWTNLATGEVHSPYPHLDLNRMKRLAFAGIHCFSSRLLPYMEDWPDKFSIIDFYLKVCAEADIRGFLQPDLQLLDVGKIGTLQAAAEFLQAQN